MMQKLKLWFKRLLLMVWALFILVVSAKITLDNPELTTLHLLGVDFSASNGFLFVLSLSGGILLGIGSVLPALYWTRLRCQRGAQREAATKKQMFSQDNVPTA